MTLKLNTNAITLLAATMIDAGQAYAKSASKAMHIMGVLIRDKAIEQGLQDELSNLLGFAIGGENASGSLKDKANAYPHIEYALNDSALSLSKSLHYSNKSNAKKQLVKGLLLALGIKDNLVAGKSYNMDTGLIVYTPVKDQTAKASDNVKAPALVSDENTEADAPFSDVWASVMSDFNASLSPVVSVNGQELSVYEHIQNAVFLYAKNESELLSLQNAMRTIKAVLTA